MRYSYSNLPYAGEPLAASFARVSKYGYDAIELVADGAGLDVDEVLGLQRRYQLAVEAVCMIYTCETDLVSSNPHIRADAVTYVKETLKRGQRIGIKVLPITPTACMKIRPESDIATEWGWARDAIREVATEAKRYGIRLVIEPWNRYETYLINTLARAREMVEDVGMANVGLKGDLFHMNIEETDVASAIESSGSLLWHMDLADSNRAAPGHGHTDWAAVVEALYRVNYQGILNFELLPAAGDPFISLKGGGAEEFKDAYTEESIARLRDEERSFLAAQA
jgi:sugar phosphate isomerase/epimerase